MVRSRCVGHSSTYASSMGSNADEKILSYNDVVLRRSDLDILSGPYFINDRIIEFYFSHLSSMYLSTDVLLVPPSISFWLMHCTDLESLEDVVRPLDLPDRKIVIFTVNDNEDFSIAEGGVHWSLLVYDRVMNVFVHHDSLGILNKKPAWKLFKAVQGCLGTLSSPSNAHFVQGSTPRQSNSYDCGLYSMAVAEMVCRWHESGSKNEGRWFSAVMEEVTETSVSNLRKGILVLIEGLMQEKDEQKAKERSESDENSIRGHGST